VRVPALFAQSQEVEGRRVGARAPQHDHRIAVGERVGDGAQGVAARLVEPGRDADAQQPHLQLAQGDRIAPLPVQVHVLGVGDDARGLLVGAHVDGVGGVPQGPGGGAGEGVQDGPGGVGRADRRADVALPARLRRPPVVQGDRGAEGGEAGYPSRVARRETVAADAPIARRSA
jgi:hypothetical protein